MLLDRIFFSLLLVFLPTQLTKHFFFDFSLVLGSRIDYYAVQISLTDIFLLLTILFWFIRRGKEVYLKTINKFKKSYIFFIACFIILNLLVSPSKELVFLKLIKLVEFSLLFVYIIFEKITFKSSIKYLLIGALYSSFIAIWQFIKQSSLGGFWQYFGERNFYVSTPGISKADIFGRLYLRPYATFPHPNVLAGFLSLLLPLLTIFSGNIKSKKQKLFILALFIVLTIALLLSFSRVAIVVGLLGFTGSLFLLKKQNKFLNTPLNYLLITLIFLLIVFGELIGGRFYNLLVGTEDTLVQRYELIKASLSMFLINPVFGIGLNNFIKFLPSTSNFLLNNNLLQPVHNTYLLILSETGIVGLVFFMLLLYSVYKKIQQTSSTQKSVFSVIFYQLLILLFFDHYFYTLQQGQLLFTILISFMIKKDPDYA